jgi:hypothetical protein
MIAMSPEREEIFRYLSKIGSDKFPEFILDLLVHVKKHRAIDMNDGPGDEKQDILTITPTGERHVTQSKHTENCNQKSNGDDLDLFFGACQRKDCPLGLFATIADLTPQGKRFITDKEYARGTGQMTAELFCFSRGQPQGCSPEQKSFAGLGRRYSLVIAGTPTLRLANDAGVPPEEIVEKWKEEVEQFK